MARKSLLSLWIYGVWVMGVLGCQPTLPSGSSSRPTAVQTQRIERYFPLADGLVYTFEIHDEADRIEDMMMMRVVRPEIGRAELHKSSGVTELILTQDAIERSTGGFILREPLHKGSEWPGDNGGVTYVRDVGMRVTTSNATLEGCIQTVEEIRKPSEGRVVSVYCPDVGIVEMIVDDWNGGERHTRRFVLRSYGLGVDLGTD